MKRSVLLAFMAVFMAFVTLACNTNKNRTATTATGGEGGKQTAENVKGEGTKIDDSRIKDALKQANLNDVRVDVDNDKKLVELKGDVNSEDERNHAQQIAKSSAPGYVVSDKIGVRPQGETQASKVDLKHDDAIKSDWKALAAQNRWENQHIRSDVKNGVLTLKGDVDTMRQHDQIEQAASKIPNVRQVVNELQVKQAAQ